MVTATKKPATAKGYFVNHAMCPEVIVGIAMQKVRTQTTIRPSVEDSQWFYNHAELWLRWLHSNSKMWRARFARSTEVDRDYAVDFVIKWANSFVKDPQTFIQKNGKKLNLSSDHTP